MNETPIIRCPYCQSANVEPGEKLWHCRDCFRDFEEAAAEFPPEPPKPKKSKKR